MLQVNIQTYKNLNYRHFSKLHQMTAYLAMFPPNLPNYFIDNFTEKGDKVFDPFCGRGTVVFEACRMGRIGIGNDLNPLAYIISKAKSDLPKKQNILRKIDKLEKEYKSADISNIPDEIRMLFDEKTTLPQLQFLKKRLNKTNKLDVFILSVLTGILHGKKKKDGTSIYCSIDMPNTFSMSPNYIKNFIKEHKLEKPSQNVFKLLRDRVNTLFEEENLYDKKDLSNYVKGFVYKKDAIKSSKIIENRFGKHSIKMILTSPPYLKVINYGKYNWIRLWLLDEAKDTVDKKVTLYHRIQNQKLTDNLSLVSYANYMRKLFDSWSRILKTDGYAFVVIGDVNNGNRTINLAQETWNLIQKNGGCKLELVDILADDITQNGDVKVTKIWGKKRGNATKIDRIMIFKQKNGAIYG